MSVFLSLLLFEICSKKAFVPDLAIVPNDDLRSSSFIPIPLSEIVRVFSLLSTSIITSGVSDELAIFLSVKPRYFLLSSASEAFEINSRKNISLSEYNELMTISRIFPVSASNLLFILVIEITLIFVNLYCKLVIKTSFSRVKFIFLTLLKVFEFTYINNRK